MSLVDYHLQGWLCRRFAFKYSISLIGPVDFSARNVPAETPSMAQPLRFRQVHLAPAQRLLSLPALSSFAGFAQRALHRGNKPFQSRLQDIIRSPDFQRFDRYVFTDRAGNKDERQIRTGILRKLQCGKAVERRKLVIRENQIDLGAFQGGQELRTRLQAGYFAIEMIDLKELLNELRVTGVILQQEDAQRRHGAFFMLPGGGSLMTAQKTPSSLTALTNS